MTTRCSHRDKPVEPVNNWPRSRASSSISSLRKPKATAAVFGEPERRFGTCLSERSMPPSRYRVSCRAACFPPSSLSGSGRVRHDRERAATSSEHEPARGAAEMYDVRHRGHAHLRDCGGHVLHHQVIHPLAGRGVCDAPGVFKLGEAAGACSTLCAALW